MERFINKDILWLNMVKNEHKIDKIDLKILYELEKNSRIAVTKLSKKLRISREIVKYRIKKLTNEGVIKNFTTIINPSRMGSIIYKVYIKFQNLNTEKRKILDNYVINHKNIFWAAKCDGSFDLILGFYVKDLMEFNNIMMAFMDKFGKNILSRHISNSVYVDFYRRDYLIGQKFEIITWGGKIQKEKLDDLMKKILIKLAKESRTTIIDLAEDLNSTPKTIISKIKEMERKNIILGYRIDLDLSKINKEYFKAIIYFQDINAEKEEDFKKYCKNNENITYYIRTIGEWDVELDIEIEDFKKFNYLLKEIKEKFGKIIKTMDTIFISEEMKGELNVVQTI